MDWAAARLALRCWRHSLLGASTSAEVSPLSFASPSASHLPRARLPSFRVLPACFHLAHSPLSRATLGSLADGLSQVHDGRATAWLRFYTHAMRCHAGISPLHSSSSAFPALSCHSQQTSLDHRLAARHHSFSPYSSAHTARTDLPFPSG